MADRNEHVKPIEQIVVCGNGLAAMATVAALSRQLPPTIRMSFVETGDPSASDLFYGTVTSRTAYEFNRAAGLLEPALVLDSDTAFSWGTKYDHWADGGRSWIQCMELSLPVIDGVLFQHYLAQQGETLLERYLVSASAARKGAFIHPPQEQGLRGGQYLLSRAEYGYQFDPTSYSQLFERSADWSRVERIRADISAVETDAAKIAVLRLSDGRTIEAGLYVDCTGPDAALLSRLQVALEGERRLYAALSETASTQLGPPVRTVAPTPFGWCADTQLQSRVTHLTIAHPDARLEALAVHRSEPLRQAEAVIAKRSKGWSGNCVAVGHAGGVVEPLTPAPIMLLERDIERLLTLIPTSSDMAVEQREYNRRFDEDHEHVGLFTRALFETNAVPETPYWHEAKARSVPEKLARKFELFGDRGVLAAYDLEPFHNEDWTVLHYGMGRSPRRYDPSADRAERARVGHFLANMRQDIDAIVGSLPSHHTYMAQLKQYLQKNEF